MLPIEEH
jgi:hypothetical protein